MHAGNCNHTHLDRVEPLIGDALDPRELPLLAVGGGRLRDLDQLVDEMRRRLGRDAGEIGGEMRVRLGGRLHADEVVGRLHADEMVGRWHAPG